MANVLSNIATVFIKILKGILYVLFFVFILAFGEMHDSL